MDEMIFRQDAIDALIDDAQHEWEYSANDAIMTIKTVPCVQSELNNNSTKLDKENVDLISRQDAIDICTRICESCGEYKRYNGTMCGSCYLDGVADYLEDLPSVESEWNNHTVACLLAELYDDTCACNYNGNDEWLPQYCDVIDSCPNPCGVACWEQFLAHRKKVKK